LTTDLSSTRKYPLKLQYLICFFLILLVELFSYLSGSLIGYRVVALLLLMTLSLSAMLFEMVPVIFMAVLSAVTWNFFFIPPLFTFHIDSAEDTLIFLLYFLIAFINIVLTSAIRKVERKARDKEEKEKIIILYNTLFNSLSHELRTPIAMIIGALDTLKENKETLSNHQRNELFSVIDMASLRLNREVDNLLNMSRLESGTLKLNCDWCDVVELAHTVVRKCAQGERVNVSISNDANLPLFKVDTGMIELIMYNLVHNAIQHNPKETKIILELVHYLDCCRIIISDNGRGFPETEIPKIFDKFYRLPGNKEGGSGLGLSIVKGCVEAHGGRITLENLQEGGSQFTLDIPAEATYISNLKNE
jgi:two-component system sensor histidine kinase KdpD